MNTVSIASIGRGASAVGLPGSGRAAGYVKTSNTVRQRNARDIGSSSRTGGSCAIAVQSTKVEALLGVSPGTLSGVTDAALGSVHP
jgi:hypothetical protein